MNITNDDNNRSSIPEDLSISQIAGSNAIDHMIQHAGNIKSFYFRPSKKIN